MAGRLAVGIDGWKGRWVMVALVDGRFHDAALHATLGASELEAAGAIGIDMPIGLPALGVRRRADIEARALLGLRRSSVFMTPSRAELEAGTHAAAVALARGADRAAMSIQAWGLRAAICEVATFAAADSRVFEVHPEISFLAMGGEPPRWSKSSWNGAALRLNLLRAQGIALTDEIPGLGGAAVADVLDAAAAAWTADRILRGVACSLPDPPELIGGRPTAIWY